MPTHRLKPNSPKKPSVARLLVAAACAMMMLSSAPVRAQQAVVLTEADVVQRALSQPWAQEVGAAEALRHRADAAQARRFENPSLAYAREQIFDTGGEDTVVLELLLPVSGRRQLLGASWEELAAARGVQTEVARHAIASAVRTDFFELVHVQERITIYDDWLAQMTQVDGELEHRVTAGESAPYERLRVQKEIADIEAAAASDRADRSARQVRLARLLGLDAAQASSLVAQATLLPTIPADDALLAAVSERPEAGQLEGTMRSADALERAAARWWVPEPTLEAGYRGVDTQPGRAHGFVAGVRLSLPFAKTTTDEELRAQALRIEATAERELFLNTRSAAALGAASRARSLTAAAQAYESTGIGTATRVVETARLAYSAGELGILELIDAYRGLVDARLTAVRIAAEARASEIEIWESVGPTAAPQTKETR